MRLGRWGYVAAGLAAAACDDGDKAGFTTAVRPETYADCMTADRAYSEALANDATLAELASCSADSECELWYPWAHCPAGNMFSQCQRATRVGNVMASESRRDEIAASTVCAPGAPKCSVGATCTTFVPRCVEGTCAAVFGVADAGAQRQSSTQ